jgi:membrane fusion protein (multidrug efflux system)
MPIELEQAKHQAAESETMTHGSNSAVKNDETASQNGNGRRGLRIALVALGIALLGLGAWWLNARNFESTDDAQVDGHMNPIGSRISGTVVAVHVENNQQVKKGDPLVDLDQGDFQIAEAQSKADFDQALAQSTGEKPNLPITVTQNITDEATGHAQVAASEATLAAAQHDYENAVARLRSSEAMNERTESDLRRYTSLLRKEEVAQSDYDQYRAVAKAQNAQVEANKAAAEAAQKTVEQRRAELNQQRSRLDQTLKNAGKLIAVRQAVIQSRMANAESASAKFDQAQLNLSYTHIVSPVDGIVTERSAEIGGRVSEGQQLMMIVQTKDLWVTANFKETQLRRMHVGQSVRIHVDALGKNFDGYIENMPAATGDRTSVLPPENATGNYVKVIQRLPVRIRFRPNQPDMEKLRPGMSVEPKVHLN